MQECSGVATALAGARRSGPWLAAGPLRPGIRLKAADEVFRIGNTAGEAHPIIGEGMSMAIQSAWILCAHLLQAGTPRHTPDHAARQRVLHESYAADWRRHFSRRLHLAAVFAHIAMRPFIIAPCLPLTRQLAPLLKHAAELSGKVRSVLDPPAMKPSASGGLHDEHL